MSLNETIFKRNFDHGYLLQIPPSIIILHAKLNIAGQQRGLFKAANSEIGRRVAPYCGSVEIRVPERAFCAPL
jgi:hypothetical protein